MTEEYINNENDPQKVLIVPEDDYVISDNEEIIQHDEILASPKTSSSFELSRRDFTQGEKVLESLRKGEFRKWVFSPKPITKENQNTIKLWTQKELHMEE